jgi:hypothetical protein
MPCAAAMASWVFTVNLSMRMVALLVVEAAGPTTLSMYARFPTPQIVSRGAPAG